MHDNDDAIAKAVVKFLTERGLLTNPMDVFEILTEVRKITQAAKSGLDQSDTSPPPAPSSSPKMTHAASETDPDGATARQPAVSPKKSIHNDYLICLEDGQRVVLLRRYLKTHYNMTPDQYRIKWGLPPDYPMVAPKFAERKSLFAKQTGFGRSHRPEFKEHYDEVKRRLSIGSKRTANVGKEPENATDSAIDNATDNAADKQVGTETTA